MEVVGQELKDKDEALRQLKVHLLHAQDLMKAQADKKRRDVTFEVGEHVLSNYALTDNYLWLNASIKN